MRLFAAVALAMAADLLTFALVVPLVGIGAETNTVMARAYLTFGFIGVALLKVALTALILLLVARVDPIHPYRRPIAAGVGITIGLFGVAGNVAAFVRWQS